VGLIYLDACLVIYLIEDQARQGKRVREAMRERVGSQFGISPLVKCECLVLPIRQGDAVLQHAYAELFEALITLEMPEPVFLQAAQLRAQFGLKTPDALHVSCAQHHRCDALWTNDGRLARPAYRLAHNILAEGAA
jgi:predicted nucleic acid-binding protein